MNEERFTGKADIYQKYRPTYPEELMEYLYTQAGFAQKSKIADIGSGTGKFSRLLLERGSTVFCVEPNEEMRQSAEKDLSGFENFISASGNDKNTGLQDKSVDFVTVAQAFHWFDRQSFKSECQRILKSGGKVALVYNNRDDSSELVRKNDEITLRYSIDTKGYRQRGDSPEAYGDFFADGLCEYKTFRNDLKFSREGFVGRNLSSSHTPKEEKAPDKYNGYVKELNELFDEYSVKGILDFPQITKSYIGSV